MQDLHAGTGCLPAPRQRQIRAENKAYEPQGRGLLDTTLEIGLDHGAGGAPRETCGADSPRKEDGLDLNLVRKLEITAFWGE